MNTRPAKKVARDTRSSDALHFLARAGFAVNGLVHIMIGLIAFGVATGTGGQADQSGALSQIAANPGGTAILWVAAVALAALGFWLILGAFLLPSSDPKKKVVHFLSEAGKGVAYLAVAGTAVTFALGGSSSSERDVDTLSAQLIAAPGGILVLWAIALVVFGVGVYFVTKGVKRRFIDDIDLPSGKAGKPIVILGVVGYVAKGIALAFMGILLGIAAFRTDPSQAAGLDGSLKTLAELPLGQVILGIIGLGFMAYGVYCFVRARIARL
ncbi:DUF1206 domain-containing protein [Salinibacterium sp. G-O1]|uniref:DUF1206 domain-containing protein n=1 Tax=Salinibacterium sp. G-O1 TaxID=3046208 RepID=UPI0024B9A955|nr:DUF1206 domain-containing protein [Salinibacterium sp. G-O1]MDJ0334036.1 DUF1206 domain-containing protein [Salinibacterium sp. G-O1]